MAEVTSTSGTPFLTVPETEEFCSDGSGESSGSDAEINEEDPQFTWQNSLASQGIPPSPRLDSRAHDAFWNRHDRPVSHNSRPYHRQSREDLHLEFQDEGNVFWGFRRNQRHQSLQPMNYGTMGHSPSSKLGKFIPGRYSRSHVLHPVGYRSMGGRSASNSVDSLHSGSRPAISEQRLRLEHAFRPTSVAIDELLSSGPRRTLVLIWIPVMLVLVWCGIPFPTDIDSDGGVHDTSFFFFLFWYFGCYVAVALIFVTQLFTLYRLNWWPKKFGAKWSYFFFWLMSLFSGYLVHKYMPIHPQKHSGPGDDGEREWQLKTEWVLLTFGTMAMPAFACFIGLRRSGRQRYRLTGTNIQHSLAPQGHTRLIPSSYRRFLWFMVSLGLSLVTLLAGQYYAIVYMKTLPHTGIDGTLYVAFWMLTVHILSAIVQWIMSEKVRNRPLLFAFKYFYFMIYFIFYRNLFARLRSFDQFALIQLLSSTWVCLWYPISMSRYWLKILNLFNSRPLSHEKHVEKISLYFYLRNIAQHTTMLAFLGWLSLLHFGINQPLYPFFAFDDNDPYNYRLTMMGSLAIWASEILSNSLTALLCNIFYGVHAAHLGLAEMRLYPELVPTLVWTSLHVLMNMLFFLIKLNFS
ncbi:Hypothetical protein MSYG_0641 [Malassezia sympodialis ATCC 42132]|uniref:Uncharacterized protein n=1 Tax=Malassezia sympodialis (strain ATCC 42132) TaxID=1230383 RepID=A0A1M8A1K4_MALS4|nr:Hypothetical protein MSYG_0641 [Malassezia sympodialis ATCC 42132]